MQWAVLWHTEQQPQDVLGKQLTFEAENGMVYMNILT